MSVFPRLSIKNFRPLLVAVLVFMMMSITSAHVRETVFVKMQENGVQRFYETEAHTGGAADVLLARLKLGRKPVEDHAPHAAGPAWPPAAPLLGRPAIAASPRAPPHQPRAPPIA